MPFSRQFPRQFRRQWGPITLFVVSMPLFLTLWPFGCRNQREAATSTTRSPDEVAAVAPRDADYDFLPHPAFAHAQSGDQGVSIADIAERALPGVVSISSTRVVRGHPFADDPFFRHFFGPMAPGGKERREQGLGSGVIISSDGVVLTNHHVIDKADEIRVTTADNRDYDAEVVGRDDKSDLAVLRLKGNVKDLTPVRFGDSSKLRLGDIVLAIGNPFGVGQTVTMGIVSAKGRANMGIVDYEDFIQTDAAINPGNSGGALINMEGELVGINTAILSRSGGNMGIGFAIPSNMARPIADSLLTSGKVVRGWLGVGIQDLDPELAKALAINATEGVVVTDVMKDGPAAKAGLARGDVIVSVSGTPVDSTGRLRNLIAAQGAKRVKLEVLRGEKRLNLEVALGEAPGELAQTAPATPGSTDGLVVEPLSDENRRKYGIEPSVGSGVLVTQVDPSSAAARAGLRAGDVIRELNRAPVRDVSSFKRAYSQAKTKLLLVQRGGGTLFIVVKEGS